MLPRLLITAHVHILALIVGVIAVPLIVAAYRSRRGKRAFNADENNKIRLDTATIIPVAVLLWNLSVYYLADIFGGMPAGGAASVSPHTLTFEGAIAAAGESTIALATAIIFCRLFGAMRADVLKD
jgi:hypothetical protein